MAVTFTKVQIDDKQFTRYINAVTKAEKKAIKKAYNATVRPIATETKRAMKTSSYNLEPLMKGVRNKAWKNAKGATVWIRSNSKHDDYFKLLFFEGGNFLNSPRYVKKRKKKLLRKKASRGNIRAGWFFRNALNKLIGSEAERFDKVLFKAIKAAEK